MKVTKGMLERLNACVGGRIAFEKKFGAEAELRDVVEYALSKEGASYVDYALWLVPRLMRIGRTSCVFQPVRDTAKSDKGASVKFWAARKGAGQARKGFSDARR